MNNFKTHIYLLSECLIGTKVFTRGDIVDLGSSDKAANIAENGIGKPLTDSITFPDTEKSIVIEYLNGLGTSDSISFAELLKKSLPVVEKKISPRTTKRKSKGDE